jgi:alanine racemase
LEKVIRPTIGILTNIGSSHDEGFVDLENKIKEKLTFKDVEILIYQKEIL